MTSSKASDSTPWDATLSGAPASLAGESVDHGEDRYELRATLGEGGMGQVVEAFDRVLRRNVALKVLRPKLTASLLERDAFVREARLTSQLEHPHIVPVHDLILEHDGQYAAFLMKRIEGRTLASWIDAQGDAITEPHVIEQVIEFMVKISDAVAFAHARSVLHLDLKSENIMLGDHGEVYVMDWGIATECQLDDAGFLRPIPKIESVRGSLRYMAPEQLGSPRDVDQRTDVHGLGAILYEILSGSPPYGPKAGAKKTDRLPRRPLSEVSAKRTLPPGLVAITERALAENRALRFASAHAFRAELEAFRRGGGWFETQIFSPGQMIVEEGERAHAAYVITEGRCEVRKRHGNEQIVLRAMGEGEVFGETALLTSGQRTASVVALTQVRVLVVTEEALERELLGRNWFGTFVRALAERFSEADRERAALRVEVHSLRKRLGLSAEGTDQ